MKSQPQSLFSSKKFSENAVKIILKKSKTKSRVILIFFWGGGIFLEVSAAELITLLNKIINLYKQTKPQEKKLFREQNKANKVSTESLYFKLFFAY